MAAVIRPSTLDFQTLSLYDIDVKDHTARSLEAPFSSPQEIYRLITPEMEQVEIELLRLSASSVSLVDHINRYLHNSGGKRIRPAVLLLCAKMCGCSGSEAVRLGSVVELIHTATLVHDDIIDDSKVRRGRSSVNAKWGNNVTVLMGDWLYMTAFYIALEERSFRVLDLLIDITRKMVEGELVQLERNGRIDITEQEHLDVVSKKTAYLFSGCARLGGMAAGVQPTEEEALAEYGFNLGMSFQLIDDMLDFTSSQAVLGKPVVNDLKEGKLTLPLIYLMKDADPKYAAKVKSLLGSLTMDPGDVETLLQWVHEGGTLERSFRKAADYAENARRCLECFAESSYRQALLQVPEFIVSREK
ncbi:MAG TPA: polyprenyl synthetase family protein [Acidobacteriota bacterium]|jgi:octaprenyl-diphosphate synthase